MDFFFAIAESNIWNLVTWPNDDIGVRVKTVNILPSKSEKKNEEKIKGFCS